MKDELKHYGVLGMQWGKHNMAKDPGYIRRLYGGTAKVGSTIAGASKGAIKYVANTSDRRADKRAAKAKRLKSKAEYLESVNESRARVKAAKIAGSQKSIDARARKINREKSELNGDVSFREKRSRSSAKRDHLKADKNRSIISDAELDSRIRRLEKEKRLHDLTSSEFRRGRTSASKFLKTTISDVVISPAKEAGANAVRGFIRSKTGSRSSSVRYFAKKA